MKAFVITIENNPYSEQVADRCLQSSLPYSIDIEKFYGVTKKKANTIMRYYNLEWTWADNNTRKMICPVTGLRQFPYKGGNKKLADLDAKKACTISHYLLWWTCIDLNEPILILEHDAVFLMALPEIDFKGICQVNDPNGATRKGKWWSEQMRARGPGIFDKTVVPGDPDIPDGLAGNSAYLIKPWAAKELVDVIHKVGVWPNDALICRQLFPWLQEYYPFVTKVDQQRSTSCFG